MFSPKHQNGFIINFFETQPLNKLEFHFVVTFRDFSTTETLEIPPPK